MISRMIVGGLIAFAIPVWSAEFRKVDAVVPPALTMQDMRGVDHDLSNYKGQVVLVNFWASWCPPCRKEMPSIQRLMQKMAGRPFVILAIDSGESREEADAYLKEMPVNFPILLDPESEEAKSWKVFAMPTSFLVDEHGRVRYVLSGGTEWDDGDGWRLIQELLSE